MIYTPENSKNLKLMDECGRFVDNACRFDSKTQRATIYLVNREGQIITRNGKPIKIIVKLNNARMVPKEDY